LDGYDEISMTGDFKVINNQGENYYNMEELGFSPILPEELAGGDSIAEAAKTFLSILNNEGTDVQNNVVLTNAAFAIKTFHPEKSFGDCFYEAEESLMGGKALKSFKKITNQ